MPSGLVNAIGLERECVRVLHEALLMSVLMYGSEMMIWKESERSRITALQMVNLRGLLGIWGMDRLPNTHIRELYRLVEGMDKKTDESVL